MSRLPNEGDRIRLVSMHADPDPIPVGTEGTVERVHRFDPPLPASTSEWDGNTPVRTQLPAPSIEAQVDVRWDVNRTLSLLLPADQYEIIDARLKEDDEATYRGRLCRINLVIGDRARVEYLDDEWEFEWLPLAQLRKREDT